MVRAINFVYSIRVNVIKNVVESTCVSSVISRSERERVSYSAAALMIFQKQWLVLHFCQPETNTQSPLLFLSHDIPETQHQIFLIFLR